MNRSRHAYKKALDCRHIRPVGLHCHIGSQILSVEPFVRAAEVMVRVARDLTAMGVVLEFIDLGGGLGISYRHDSEIAPTQEEYAAAVVPVFRAGIEDIGISPDSGWSPAALLSQTRPCSSPG